MATALEIKQQIEQLQKQFIEQRALELSDVISDMKEKIKTYELTAEDLGFYMQAPVVQNIVQPAAATTEKKQRKEVAIKYMHQKNEELTWTGRGIQPKWMSVGISAGEFTMEDCLIVKQGSDESPVAPVEEVKAEEVVQTVQKEVKEVVEAPIEFIAEATTVEQPEETKEEKKKKRFFNV